MSRLKKLAITGDGLEQYLNQVLERIKTQVLDMINDNHMSGM